MTKTLTDLISDLRDRLGETVEAEWSDLELARYLNDGVTDIARRTETLQEIATIAGTPGTQQYALPTDTIRFYRCEWIPDSGNVYPLEYRDFNTMDSIWWTNQTQTQSTPQFFTAWGFPPSLNMVVYPTPAETGDFKVFYYRLPATMTSGANVAEVPAGWEDLIVLYGEYLALRKDHDPRWQEAKNLYETSLETMIEQTRRWTDQAGMIVNDNGVAQPWWLSLSDGYDAVGY